MTGQGDEFKFQAPYSKPSIKLSTYDGKSSWQVYKTQFSIVADANQWDSQTKACHRLQLKSRQQKVSETLQELATDAERLSHLAFSDCPTEVREVLALQHFIDGVRDPEIQKALRMADLKDLKGALVFAMKFEAAQQATRKDRHPIRANESDTRTQVWSESRRKKTLKCWTCGGEGHLQRSCRARQGDETNKRLPEGGVGKLINGHLAEVARFLESPTFQCVKFRQRVPRNLSGPAPVVLDRDGEKTDIHGKLKVKIQFGDTTYRHAVYVADIADLFILGLDFLKEHGFTLDFNKNELRSIHEEVTIFKIDHRTESIRQKMRNCPPEQKSSAERLFQEFEDVFSRNSSDIGHTTVTQHRIDTADHHPIKQHPRRLPFAKQEEVGTLLREMQENDIIEPSSSPWASPIVLVRGRFEEHLQNIRKGLSKLSDANLKLNPSKCKFFQKEVNYLGHNLCRRCSTDPEKVSAVKNCKRPENLQALTSSPILIYPQPDKPFILDTDASNESVGAVLYQEIDGQKRVVAYWSKCLSKPERNYCVTRKELLAIVKAIEHFHHYLYGQKFLLRYRSCLLTWLMNFRNTEGQVARWIQRLNDYFDIRHRKGSSHGNADALSRRPCPENCHRHCSRVETKYDYAIRQITTSTATPPDPWE
ncbi:retrovirus-related Pol polyprotein from transposon 297 [Trichonephila clavipes]|nr:retrovirus-related Pol polyprotein from transposon 297 [Trichonephila clavipes]